MQKKLDVFVMTDEEITRVQNEPLLFVKAKRKYLAKIRLIKSSNTLEGLKRQIINHNYFDQNIYNTPIRSCSEIKEFLDSVKNNNYEKIKKDYFPNLIGWHWQNEFNQTDFGLIKMLSNAEKKLGLIYPDYPTNAGSYEMVDYMTANYLGPNTIKLEELEVLTLAWLYGKKRLDEMPKLLKIILTYISKLRRDEYYLTGEYEK